jgi:uncharacterized membrane protein
MKQHAIAYVVVLVVALGIDALWLTLAYGRLYKPHLAHLLADKLSYTPVALFYLVFAAGIVFFAVSPALTGGSWLTATLHGAAFGFCAYATYDLTCQATLRDWPPLITVIDICWGTILTSTAATAGFFASSRL